MKRCILKKDKDKAALRRHPWIFSGAIDKVDEGVEPGDMVRVFSSTGQTLGSGYLNPQSQIAVRLLAYGEETLDPDFLKTRILRALHFRRSLFKSETETNAYRLIHSEGDFLPGLIVDRYGSFLVAQFLTAGMEKLKPEILKILSEAMPQAAIYEKSSEEVRQWEGLQTQNGALVGDAPPDKYEIHENKVSLFVDIPNGQKTGFYLDQREHRQQVMEMSRGRRVLNTYAYTGGFSVYASKGGAISTTNVETSKPAISVMRDNFARNGMSRDKNPIVEEDVPSYLRNTSEQFDLIILDPPAFCKNRHQIDGASRGYKDINLYGIRRLKPGGLLFTFSCSSYMTPELFQKIVFSAALDAGRRIKIVQKLSQPPDHPVNIYHPEGEYLKGLICLVDD